EEGDGRRGGILVGEGAQGRLLEMAATGGVDVFPAMREQHVEERKPIHPLISKQAPKRGGSEEKRDEQRGEERERGAAPARPDGGRVGLTKRLATTQRKMGADKPVARDEVEPMAGLATGQPGVTGVGSGLARRGTDEGERERAV